MKRKEDRRTGRYLGHRTNNEADIGPPSGAERVKEVQGKNDRILMDSELIARQVKGFTVRIELRTLLKKVIDDLKEFLSFEIESSREQNAEATDCNQAFKRDEKEKRRRVEGDGWSPCHRSIAGRSGRKSELTGQGGPYADGLWTGETVFRRVRKVHRKKPPPS